MPIQTYGIGITPEQILKMLLEGWKAGGITGVRSDIAGAWGGDIYGQQLIAPERDLTTGKYVYTYVPQTAYGQALALKQQGLTELQNVTAPQVLNISGTYGGLTPQNYQPPVISQAFETPAPVGDTTQSPQIGISSSTKLLLILGGLLLLKEVKL